MSLRLAPLLAMIALPVLAPAPGAAPAAFAWTAYDMTWVAASGSKMPAGALAGGFEPGRKLFICRAKVRAVVFPGTVVEGRCSIAFGSHELKERPYEVLVIE